MSNSEYLYQDTETVKLDHPDAAIRLAAVVHRFRVPKMSANRKLSFKTSFATAGRHDKTRRLMQSADDHRERLRESTGAEKISSERVVNDARRSCKVQPEMARLDKKLIFEWMSGIEHNPKAFISEALMYDLTMAVACEGLGRAAAATEKSVAGDFAAASRDYAAAAGVFEYLHADHLPKWISKGSNVDASKLPSECHASTAKALKLLFQANGQQMAVATVLIKPGTPNYALLAKLTLGIAEVLEDFSAYLRRECFESQSRMDKDFFTLVSFQTGVQQALSLYFSARAAWDATDYGIAIALMSEATVALRTREAVGSRGLPDITRTPALVVLKQDLHDLRAHCTKVLHEWEKDNNSVFYNAVPQHVPAGKKLQEGLKMNRMEAYTLEEAEPHLLVIPEGDLQRSDSDLARELQERLNAGDD
eukprot:scaffold443_cov177-Amphora_coffeaeformis.AAC.1